MQWLGGEGLWKVVRSWLGGALMDEISALRRDHSGLPSPFHDVRTQ